MNHNCESGWLRINKCKSKMDRRLINLKEENVTYDIERSKQ